MHLTLSHALSPCIGVNQWKPVDKKVEHGEAAAGILR
jgi:hypothetical protein